MPTVRRSSGSECPPMRLDLVPVTLFSKRFDVRRDGASVADVTLGGDRRRKGRIGIGDAIYDLRRDRLDGALVLERDGTPVVQAVRRRMWKAEYDVEWADERLAFTRPSGDERTFEAERDGRRLGRIHKPTFWSRRVDADVPDDWPLEAVLFLALLALMAWDDT